MRFTEKRKRKFAADLGKYCSKIGFVNVGSGGEFNSPWNLQLKKLIQPIHFESTSGQLCLSNCKKRTELYVAKDEPASSLHEVNADFVNRFGLTSLMAVGKKDVECITLDEVILNKVDQVDCLDVNAKGHDYQVFQGGKNLLSYGFVKLIKVEFELSEVWKGQGWFSDIDQFLRGLSYELVDMDIEYVRPKKAKSIFHRGEPIWGKAIYVPSEASWLRKMTSLERKNIKDQAVKGIILYTLFDCPARALGILDIPLVAECFTKNQLRTTRSKLLKVYDLALLDRVFRKLGRVNGRIDSPKAGK